MKKSLPAGDPPRCLGHKLSGSRRLAVVEVIKRVRPYPLCGLNAEIAAARALCPDLTHRRLRPVLRQLLAVRCGQRRLQFDALAFAQSLCKGVGAAFPWEVEERILMRATHCLCVRIVHVVRRFLKNLTPA